MRLRIEMLQVERVIKRPNIENQTKRNDHIEYQMNRIRRWNIDENSIDNHWKFRWKSGATTDIEEEIICTESFDDDLARDNSIHQGVEAMYSRLSCMAGVVPTCSVKL